MTRHKARAASRDRLRLLATLAELRAEIARRPLIQQRQKAFALKEEIEALAATRQDLRATVDGVGSGATPFSNAAYLTARGADLRQVQARHYQALALIEADTADFHDKAARARARADVLARLCRTARKP